MAPGVTLRPQNKKSWLSAGQQMAASPEAEAERGGPVAGGAAEAELGQRARELS